MAKSLQLGLNTGYWAGGPPPNVVAMVKEAEALGYDSMWTSEAYGSDCISVSYTHLTLPTNREV